MTTPVSASRPAKRDEANPNGDTHIVAEQLEEPERAD